MPKTSSAANLHGGDAHAAPGRDLNRVGQIEFVLVVPVADRIEDLERHRPGDPHDPAIHEADRPLGLARVPLLADGDELLRSARSAGHSRSDRPAASRRPRSTRPARACRAAAISHRRSRRAYRRRRRSRRPHFPPGPCAPPAPRARCRAARIARGRRRPAHARRRLWPRHPGRARPRPRSGRHRRPCSAFSTCAIMGSRPIWCSIFGSAERIRFPSPAASTTARALRIGLSLLRRGRRIRLASGCVSAKPARRKPDPPGRISPNARSAGLATDR